MRLVCCQAMTGSGHPVRSGLPPPATARRNRHARARAGRPDTCSIAERLQRPVTLLWSAPLMPAGCGRSKEASGIGISFGN